MCNGSLCLTGINPGPIFYFPTYLAAHILQTSHNLICKYFSAKVRFYMNLYVRRQPSG